MTNVIIHGEMGEIFGKTHKFKVFKLLEILRALSISKNGFKNYVIDKSNNGLNYAMIDPKNPEKTFKSAQDFQEANAPETIHIVPAVGGAFIFTAMLIIKTAAIAVGGFLASGSFLANLAIGLIIQGVMSLLFPVEIPKAQTAESKIDTSSYIFSNLDNNLVQGFPIPLMYGELRIGSNIIGTNVVSEDLGGNTQANRVITSSTQAEYQDQVDFENFGDS